MSKRKKRNENKETTEQKQLSITDKAREEWLESKKEEEEEEQQIIITDGEVEEEVGDIEYPEEDEEEVKEVEETTKENKKEDKKDTKKDTKKGTKKDTKKDNKPLKSVVGPRPVIIYGKEIYIEEDTTLSLEQIRAKLVDEYKFNEFADKTKVVMEYDDKTGEVRPMIELKKKG